MDKAENMEAVGWPQLDRRSVLGAGAATMAISSLAVGTTSAFAADVEPFRYVVIDSRHQESVLYGRALANQGADILDVAEGLTQIWQDKLAPLWRGNAGSVSGLTNFGTYSVLAEQARGEAKRSRVIGRHMLDNGSGKAAHGFAVPTNTTPLATAVASATQWPVALADLTARCRVNDDACTRHWHGETIAARPISLVSWMIG